MMKKEAARLCGNARMAGQFALQEQEKYGIVKTDRRCFPDGERRLFHTRRSMGIG